MRRWRTVAAAATMVLSATLLTACTGDGQAAAFKRAFAADPAIASVELTSHDNQAFTGGVSGEVFADVALVDAEFVALADRISAYTRANFEQMQGNLVLVVDGYEMVVTGDEPTDAAVVQLLLAFRADERVRSAQIQLSSISIMAVDVDAAISVLQSVPELVGVAGVFDGRSVFVRSEDRAIDVGGELPQLDAALVKWHGLADEFPLTGMRLRDAALTVTLRHESDFARAQQVSSGQPAPAGLVTAFASELIRFGESDGSRARELVSRLGVVPARRVAWVWESGTRLQIAVTGEENLGAVAASLSAALPAGTTSATLEVVGVAGSRIDISP